LNGTLRNPEARGRRAVLCPVQLMEFIGSADALNLRPDVGPDAAWLSRSAGRFDTMPYARRCSRSRGHSKSIRCEREWKAAMNQVAVL
jgi:hypothetical protein